MKLSNLLLTSLMATTISSCVTTKVEKKQENKISEFKKDPVEQLIKVRIREKEISDSCRGCGLG